MYKMSNLEIYIHAFDATVDASAAQLPEELSDSFGSFNVIFDTSLNAASVASLTFTRNGDDLSLQANPIDFAASAGVFSVANSLYESGITFYSMKSGDVPGSVPILTDDYLGYIADRELGSELLVGAFENVPQIVASIDDGYIISNFINNGLTNSFDISQFDTNNMTGDHSALWVIYSEVFKNHPDRLTAPADNVTTPLLQAGDVLVMKLVINTPDLDSTITAYHPSGMTPVKPTPRTYKIRIAIV